MQLLSISVPKWSQNGGTVWPGIGTIFDKIPKKCQKGSRVPPLGSKRCPRVPKWRQNGAPGTLKSRAWDKNVIEKGRAFCPCTYPRNHSNQAPRKRRKASSCSGRVTTLEVTWTVAMRHGGGVARRACGYINNTVKYGLF